MEVTRYVADASSPETLFCPSENVVVVLLKVTDKGIVSDIGTLLICGTTDLSLEFPPHDTFKVISWILARELSNSLCSRIPWCGLVAHLGGMKSGTESE